MKKIKVLHFPMANAFSGVTQYVLENWRFIDRERFQFDFATLSKTKLHFEDQVAAQGCKVFYISCYAEENKERFSEEIRQILREGYDAVHLHTSFWKSFLVEELAREAGVPKIIIHSHNTNVLGESGREESIARHRRCVAALDPSVATDYWACSRTAAKWLYGDSIPKERIVIQKNAIDVERFRYNPAVAREVRSELGWEGRYVIGHVGRFTYQKNHAFLLSVFREVHEKNPDTRLLLVGFGPEREKIETMVRDWQLGDAVCILEKRDDVYRLVQAMDCFALPSRFEGLPIVVIEAQASGCVCLMSDAVTEEVMLTDSILRLPLREEQWVEALLPLSESARTRPVENADAVRACGYDLRDQIKQIEKGYSL